MEKLALALITAARKLKPYFQAHMIVVLSDQPLKKVRAILELEPPRTVKAVQSLNGKIAALNRFISKVTDKCLPFFRVLRKYFEWTDERRTVPLHSGLASSS